MPIHQFTDSLNWTRKNHTFQFGTDLFFIRNNHTSFSNSFSDVRTNAVYLNTGGIAGTSSPLDPVNNGFPAVDGNFGPNYDSAATIVMGIFPEGDGIITSRAMAAHSAQGQAINRRYAINDYELFGQDTWRMTPRLTVTYGLRWVLEAPPYETNGYQVAPCMEAVGGGCTKQNAADWFNHSAALATAGQPANNAGELSFILGGPKNHGPGLWNWDHKNFSPRFAVAWSPDTGDGWASKILGKKDQFSIRGGYSIMYDHFGIPIVNSFDQNGSFGLSTILGNPAGVVSPSNAPRFTCLTPGAPGILLASALRVHQRSGLLVRTGAHGWFPLHARQHCVRNQLGVGPNMKTPYSHVFNFSLSRQIQLPIFTSDRLCGQHSSTPAHASRSGHANQPDRSGQ